MNRRQRRALDKGPQLGMPTPAEAAVRAALAGPPPDVRLHPTDLAGLPADKTRDGDPRLLNHPAVTDGSDASRRQARQDTARAIVEQAEEEGATLHGDVVFYEWGPRDVPEVLATLMVDDPRFRQFAPWFVEHPEGTLLVAAIVATPGPTITGEAPSDG